MDFVEPVSGTLEGVEAALECGVGEFGELVVVEGAEQDERGFHAGARRGYSCRLRASGGWRAK